jgi:uncharacterized membrane protein
VNLLYLEGDACSRKYLLGALRAAGIAVEAPRGPPDELASYDVALLSDFEAPALGDDAAEAMVEAVRAGLGLVMVGGWTSFGRGGYARSPLAQALPVEVEDGDDRQAAVRGVFPVKMADHPVLGNLDWARAPLICGYNRVRPKPAAEVALRTSDGAALLVLGGIGQGRTAAYASDLAPHWSGGMTDWGESSLPGPEGEEVGTAYVAFLAQLVRWCARPRPQQGQERVERA